MKNYVQEGKRLDYTNDSGEKILSGQAVVVKGQVGVAFGDIEDGEEGTLSLEGVYTLPKKNGDVIEKLDPVYLDENGEITLSADDGGAPATEYAYVGRAFADAEAGATEVNVKLIIL